MKKILVLLATLLFVLSLSACNVGVQSDFEGEASKQDTKNQFELQDRLSESQPTPTDFTYSLERFNLIKRAYWVNGQRDVAASLTLPVADMPIGYIALYDHGVMVGAHAVLGKVSSLESYLTKSENCEPIDHNWENEGYSDASMLCRTLADVDGSYGENAKGVFFFNTYGEYVEWTGVYYYSDYAFDVPDTAINRMGLE